MCKSFVGQMYRISGTPKKISEKGQGEVGTPTNQVLFSSQL